MKKKSTKNVKNVKKTSQAADRQLVDLLKMLARNQLAADKPEKRKTLG